MNKWKILSGKFQKKLILGFIASSLIPLLAAFCFFYATSIDIAKTKILNTVELSSRQLHQSIEYRINQIEQLADSVHYYVYKLAESPAQPTSDYLTFYSNSRTFISSMSDSFDLLSTEIYLDDSCFVSEEGLMFHPLHELQDLIPLEEQTLSGVYSGWKLFPKRQMVTSSNTIIHPENCFSYFSAKSNLTTQALDYAYILNISCDELSEQLKNAFSEPEINIFITDASGTIIAASRPALTGTALSSDLQNRIVSDTHTWNSHHGYQILTLPLEQQGLFLITEMPDSYIRKNTNVLIHTMFLALFTIIIATCFTVYFITRTFSRRVFILSNTIDQFSQNQEPNRLDPLRIMIRRPEKQLDEIDGLASSFLDMSDRLDKSFQQILNLSLQEEKLNYQLLQSKINPHFLYNILESIKTCQTLGYIDTANLMITKLARFYRQLLQKGEDMITIREELNMVVTYLEIEALCHRDCIRWNLHLDDDIDNFLICKFTLQPIVENCIVHAIRSSSQPITIDIHVHYEEDSILIQITDDGVGIQSDKLKDLQEALETRRVFYSKHYGITNVNARLSIISQGDSNIRIESTRNVGTTVTVTIPQIL